jgi:hypothetical protein
VLFLRCVHCLLGLLVSNRCGRVARTRHAGAHTGSTYRLEREREGSLRDQYVI